MTAPTVTILIVEDHPLVAKFYRLALERVGGFACVTTEKLDEILAAVDSGQISLALLDVSLRGTYQDGQLIDGTAISKLIKQRDPELPILIATAHAMDGDRERLLVSSGANDYLQKPIYDAQLLVDKVRQLLHHVS